MFGATKAFAAVAVLALAGGILAVTVNDERAATEPGAGTITTGAGTISPGALDIAAMAPRPVSGTITDGEWPETDEESLGGGLFGWTSQPVATTWDATDYRLQGTGTLREHGLQHFDTYTGLRSTAWSIETKDGGWLGSGHAYSSANGGQDFLVLSGTGAYEGLSAYIAVGPGATASVDTDVRTFEGVIFPGTMAPPPELLSGD